MLEDTGYIGDATNDGKTVVIAATSHMRNANHGFRGFQNTTPRARPVNWGTYLPITEWLNGLIHHDVLVNGVPDSVSTRNLVGNPTDVKRFAISNSTPEIGMLIDVLNGNTSELATDGVGLVWFDSNDSTHSDFSAKLFRILLLNYYHWKLDFDPYLPSFGKLGIDRYSVVTAPPSYTMTTAFPEWRRPVTGSGHGIGFDDMYTFVEGGVEVLPFFGETPNVTISQLYDPTQLSAYGDAWDKFDIQTMKGFQIPIYYDDLGRVCVRMNLIQGAGITTPDFGLPQPFMRVDRDILYARLSFAYARQGDAYGDYGIISMPMSLDSIYREPYVDTGAGFADPGLLNHRAVRRFKGNVQRYDANNADVRDDDDIAGPTYNAVPYCSILGGHESTSNSSDAVTIMDITLCGHMKGRSTLGYTKSSRSVGECGNYIIRDGAQALHLLEMGNPATGNLLEINLMSTGLFPTLPENSYVSTQLHNGTLNRNIVFGQSNVQLSALELVADETGPTNVYTVNGINSATDEGVILATDELEAVLDTGYFFLSGRVNRFGDARWTIQ